MNATSPGSRSGLKDTILAPRRRCPFQFGEHARMVGPRVLTDDEDGVGLLEIIERHGPFADADRLGEGEAARFMAHVRAIRQVVSAEPPSEQLIKKRRFVAGAARSVKQGLVRMFEFAQLCDQSGQTPHPNCKAHNDRSRD